MARKSNSSTALKSVPDEGTQPEAKAEKTGPNPFKAGTSAAFVFDALLKGGNIETIAATSVKKFPVKPRHADQIEDLKAHALNEGKLRVKDAMRRARNDGLTVEGPDEQGNVRIVA